MRFAIFGDIHANHHALKAVLDDAKTHMCTHFVCMGDIVGYNAFPKQCIEVVRQLDCPVVKGNHDEQASMMGDQDGFNPLAEEAINWTREQLSSDEKEWLRSLRLQRQVRDFTIVHATLDTPHKWGYVFNQLDAAASFNYQHTSLCFIRAHSLTQGLRPRWERSNHSARRARAPAGKEVSHQRWQRRAAARWRLARSVLCLRHQQQ